MYQFPTKKQAEAFGKDVLAAFNRLGVRLVDEDMMYQYEIDTSAGKLSLNVHEDWIACRFDDVPLARQKVGFGTLNQFSGKWNWHGLDCVSDFEEVMKTLLPN